MDIDDALRFLKNISRTGQLPSFDELVGAGAVSEATKTVDDEKIMEVVLDLIGSHPHTARLMATGIPQMFNAWVNQEKENSDSTEPAIEATVALVASMLATIVMNIAANKGESLYDKQERLTKEIVKSIYASTLDSLKGKE